ncbi:hypothetical protein Lfu02_61150 [Longispora fulva]|uniref:Transcription elongation factor n=1 Tax=Longispora fulva TaxID=619741 RepID=A0A8J7KDX4_9ACTN|nr:hypothetical protein [Longispora fulva]MBG6134535.1 transcription elongation factor [Longispora fulva]GIG61743.1 hypothetical protein Lfu02_61150 [Longispora fulva]
MNLKLKIAAVVCAAALMSSIGVAAVSSSPAMASDPGANCNISASGSPGWTTFTLHVASDTCAWRVRPYALCNDNTTWKFGDTLTAAGASQTKSCPIWGLNDWGYDFWSGESPSVYHHVSMK